MTVDLTIINVENAAGGFGVTPQIAEELFDLGADVLTTGNHVWDKRELLEYLASVPADSQDRARRMLRPANMQPGLPGYGVYEGIATQNGVSLCGRQPDGQGFHERHQRSRSTRPMNCSPESRPKSSWSISTPKPPAKKSPWAGISTDESLRSSAPTPTSPPPTSASCRRHRLSDRRRHERPLRQRNRRRERTGAASIPTGCRASSKPPRAIRKCAPR